MPVRVHCPARPCFAGATAGRCRAPDRPAPGVDGRPLVTLPTGAGCSVEPCPCPAPTPTSFGLGPRDALEGKGPQRRPQRRLDRRLEEVAKAVGGGYCRLQMPSKPALGVRGTVAGRRLGALEGGRWYLPPLQRIPLWFPHRTLRQAALENVSPEEGILYARMHSTQIEDRQGILEDLLVYRVVDGFRALKVPLLRPEDVKRDLYRGPQNYENVLLEVHSREAYEMIENHIRSGRRHGRGLRAAFGGGEGVRPKRCNDCIRLDPRPRGALWRCFAPFGTPCHSLAPFGTLWHPLALVCAFWHCFALLVSAPWVSRLSSLCSPSPPLSKLRPCPSDSGRRGRINSVPHLIRYEMSGNRIRHGFGDKSANDMESWTHLL